MTDANANESGFLASKLMSPTTGQSRYTLAIVGGGPSCTYAIERLAANLSQGDKLSTPLSVIVFDKDGKFGAGSVHDPSQTGSSYLNRIAGQVCFAADDSNVSAGALLDQSLRPVLHEWAQKKYQQSGDEKYNLGPQDWPKRAVHGEALTDAFNRYVAVLRSVEGVDVQLLQDEINDIEKIDSVYQLHGASGRVLAADDILLVTGHSNSAPELTSHQRDLHEFSIRHSADKATRFVHYAYPVETSVGEKKPDERIGVIGLGLTAIDVFLYATEGRGGYFEPQPDGHYVYHRCGREPDQLIGFSRSGLFTYVRPHNEKERDIERFEHKGILLNHETIDTLRLTRGTTKAEGSAKRQLDFERDVWPIAYLEHYLVYYQTLFGQETVNWLLSNITPWTENFINGGTLKDVDNEAVLNSLDREIDHAINHVFHALAFIFGTKETASPNNIADLPASLLSDFTERFLRFIAGESEATTIRQQVEQASLTQPGCLADFYNRLSSPFGHSKVLDDHRFSWKRLIDPLADVPAGPAYHQALINFMVHDHQQARQNNLSNPDKAVCDGLWRDLRQVMAYVIDDAGLTPDSHALFLKKYMPVHNRLGNGACLDAMEKMLALIRAGVLDISFGKNPVFTGDEESGEYLITSANGCLTARVNTLIEARIHEFDPGTDRNPLYRNMLQRGLITQWMNQNKSHGQTFTPGGIQLTDDFHPVNAQHQTEHGISVLGPPSEGKFFFQIGAARPNQNHHVLNDMIKWANQFLKKMDYAEASSKEEIA